MIVPSVSAVKICSWKLEFWCCFISQVAHYHLFSYIFQWVIAADLTSMSKQLGKQYHIGNRLNDILLLFVEYDRIFTVQPRHAHNDLKKITPLWADGPLLWSRRRLESCKFLVWMQQLSEAALKLSMYNCVCASLSLFFLNCIRIFLIHWQLTP